MHVRPAFVRLCINNKGNVRHIKIFDVQTSTESFKLNINITSLIMSKLAFKNPYLFITTFDSIELNPLTILTGLNGSGKSHLLQSILNGSSTIDEYKPGDIRYFDYRNFNAENEKSTSDIEINTVKTDLLQGLKELPRKNRIEDIKQRFSSFFSKIY